MSADGLSLNEKVDILFKKYMNFVSTDPGRDFTVEDKVSNTSNIFSDFIMTERPSTTTHFISESSGNAISRFNDLGFNVDDTWYNGKVNKGVMGSSAGFQADSSNPSVIRFNKIKLDHIVDTASFSCLDHDGNVMLRNMIPFNYAVSGYSIELYYRTFTNTIVSINWLDPISIQRSLNVTNDATLEWGAPLFDTTNGVVTFYDTSYVTSSNLNEVFGDQDFYISCTKYVGAMGISGGTGGTADNDHVEFNTVSGISPLTALNTTLSGEIVSTTAGGTANNDHVEFNTVSGISSLTALNTTLSGEIMSVTASSSGGTADNDHVEFAAVPGRGSLTALNTTLSGEIVATTAGGTTNNDHVEFNTVSGIGSLTSLNTTLSGEIVATTAGGTANNDHVEFNTVPSITSLSSLNTTLSGEIMSVIMGTTEGTADNDHVEFTAVPSITSLTALDTNTMTTTHIDGDMTISTKLGIGNGTTTPGFSLDVHDVGTNNLSEINGYYLDENSGVTSASSMTSSITIRAQNDILSGGKIIAESDRRIKKDMVALSKEDSLALVRNLMPKKYHYIDSTQKGGELVYGYVAQEVKEVLPSAVQHIQGAIPSIFEMAQVSRSKNNTGTMLTFRHYDTQNLDPSCEVLKLVDARNNDRLVHIAKVVDARRLEIEEQVEEGQIFVYGEEVQDFHVLSKDYINVVAVSALQQMDSQVTQLKEENRALRGELNEIKKILQNNGMI